MGMFAVSPVYTVCAETAIKLESSYQRHRTSKVQKNYDSLFWKENFGRFAHRRRTGLWRRFE
jgi:hypothetical protein